MFELENRCSSHFKMINSKNTKRLYSDFRIYFSFIVIVVISFIQIHRLLYIPITWDEGLTYVRFVNRFFHEDGFITGLFSFFRGEIGAPANNHFLNTILIGLADKITHSRYNEIVIRLPIFLFWIVYVIVCTKQFLKKNLSFVAYTLLMCCSYVNEFFALARGYGFAAVLILISQVLLEKWISDDKDQIIVFAFFLLIFAELANTAALIVTAAYVVTFIIIMIRKRRLFLFIKRKWFMIFIWTILQIVVIKLHFFITKMDESLYNDKVGGLMAMLKNTITLPVYSKKAKILLIIFLSILVILNLLLIIMKKRSLFDYSFSMMLTFYFIICYLAVQLSKSISNHVGYPIGRVLVISYPVFVFAINELIKNSYCKVKDEMGGRILEYFRIAISFCVIILCLYKTNYSLSTNWTTAGLYKEAAYDIYLNHNEKNSEYLKTIQPNLDAFIFWEKKILFENGYDIFVTNGR